jgi:hypothetical protein
MSGGGQAVPASSHAVLATANTWAAAQSFAAKLVWLDVNVDLGTTTGTKLGTATSQKLGFWNVTPVVQPAHADQAAAAALTQDALTDNSGGSATTTLAAISDTATKDAVASLAAQLAKVKTDVANTRTLLTAIRTALVAIGLMKGAA